MSQKHNEVGGFERVLLCLVVKYIISTLSVKKIEIQIFFSFYQQKLIKTINNFIRILWIILRIDIKIETKRSYILYIFNKHIPGTNLIFDD